MPSPPKPWERSGGAVAAAPPTVMSSNPQNVPSSSTPASTSSSNANAAPAVPTRPPALSPSQPTYPGAAAAPYATGSAYSPYGSTAYSAPYSSYSPYNRLASSYGSSYSPYGMGSMGGMYGGVGGYGAGYSPYGMNSMYPAGGMYPGGPPPFGSDPNAPSLTQTLEATTAQTFGLLHALVQTFGGVAQMLESTFTATHASFFAVLGVVDQLGALRAALGSVLGLFGLVRWARDTLAGRGPGAGAGGLRGEFRDFVQGRPPAPRPSKKPLVIFLLAVLGVPYAMHRLVRALLARQAAAAQQAGALPPLEPAQLEFARALYPFEPSSPAELALHENEIVAIMGKLDPASGAEVDPRIEVEGSEWWKGRTREGREGWFPRKFVQILERRQPPSLEGAAEVKKVE